MDEFIGTIVKNLEANGFPEKRISLPTEKMYEVSDSKGFSFNEILKVMKEEYQIHHDIGDDKIIFSKVIVKESDFPNLNPEMMAKAKEMMGDMDPAEFQKIQDQIENMSDEEKTQMMEKAKGMGIF